MSGLGNPHLHLRVVDSTNARARGLAVAGAPHGTLVTAGRQTAGRGRQGRGWSAPAGRCLVMSLVVRDPPPLLSLRAGAAVARTAQALDARGRCAMVKWPNDVLLDGGKVAGILVEGRSRDAWAVLGIGLNVAVDVASLAPEIRGRAASLDRAPGEIESALRVLLGDLEAALALDERALLEELADRDALRGRPVRWADGVGTGAGLDGGGRLLVATDMGRVALDSGEVHLESPDRRGAADHPAP